MRIIRYIKPLYSFFSSEVSRVKTIVLTVCFGLISTLEILAYQGLDICVVIASRLWLATAGLVFVFALVLIAKLLISDIKRRRIPELLAFTALFTYLTLLAVIPGMSALSPEAALQVRAGLDSFSFADLNYTGTAFIGYANRQYLINALPSLLFGRSIAALHMGYALPFMLGLAMIYVELKERLRTLEYNESLALIPLYAIPAFRFITEYYTIFEQAISAVSATMLAAAFFLRFTRKKDIFTCIALTWAGGFLSGTYTPALASLGLLIFLLVCIGATEFRREIKLCATDKSRQSAAINRLIMTLSVIITIVSFFVASILGNREDRFDSLRTGENLFGIAAEALADVFGEKKVAFFGGALIPVLLYLVFSLTLQLETYDLAVSFWILGVIVAAEVLKGFSIYDKDVMLQRNMIIIPVLVTSAFLSLVKKLKLNRVLILNRHIFLTVITLVLMMMIGFFGRYRSFKYYNYTDTVKFTLVYATELEKEGVITDDEFNIILISDNLLQTNLFDYTEYFYPKAKAETISSKGQLPGYVNLRTTYVFAEDGKQLEALGLKGEVRVYRNIPKAEDISIYCAVIGPNDLGVTK